MCSTAVFTGQRYAIVVNNVSGEMCCIRRQAVATPALTGMPKFIEANDRKLSEIQVRFDELSEIRSKYEMAQDEQECSGDTFCK